MTCDTVPGDQVICVFDNWDTENGEIAPVKGQVYTVKTVEHYSDTSIGLTFFEIENPILQYEDMKGECTFSYMRFKKVKKSDISILQEILKNPKRPIKETSYQ